MPSQKKKTATSNKLDNRGKIDHEMFCQLVSEGMGSQKALIAAGGADNRAYANTLKHKHKERIREITLDRAADSATALVNMTPKALQVLEESLTSPDVKQIDKARLAKDIVSSVQDFLPKQTEHKHTHKHEVSREEAEATAKALLTKFLGGVDGSADVRIVDAVDIGESGRSEDSPTSGATEQE